MVHLLRERQVARDLDFARTLARDLDLDLARDLARDLNFNPELQQKLQQLKDQLPPPNNWESYKQWWKDDGQAWTERFRQVMIHYRNIGHDWQFTDAQKELLKQYYTANQLLVACLNSEHYSSQVVREQIEATLLLPLRSSSPTE